MSEDLVVLFNKRVISQGGHPRKIVSDRGNEFTSRLDVCSGTGDEDELYVSLTYAAEPNLCVRQ